MNKYRINEIFYSIQCEGYWSGTPAVFIRFSGCNLNCPFCDTDHEQGMWMDMEEIYSKISELQRQTIVMGGTIWDGHNTILVLTGGEPLLQLDAEFLSFFCGPPHWKKYSLVQIETNGTKLPRMFEDHDLFSYNPWITVSPKSITGHEHEYWQSIHECKIVLDQHVDPEEFYSLGNVIRFQHYFIQPCWPLRKEFPLEQDYEEAKQAAFERAVTYVKEHPWWRLSLQTQKMLRIQ